MKVGVLWLRLVFVSECWSFVVNARVLVNIGVLQRTLVFEQNCFHVLCVPPFSFASTIQRPCKI